jgi:hypothetical protein
MFLDPEVVKETLGTDIGGRSLKENFLVNFPGLLQKHLEMLDNHRIKTKDPGSHN